MSARSSVFPDISFYGRTHVRGHLISINWTAQPLTPEQLLVIRNVAAIHLRRGGREREIDFSHELCEGRLIRKSEGLFVTFVGTFFTADLGLMKGERWTIDFLLPAGSEQFQIDEDCLVLSTRILPSGKFLDQQVDTSLSKTSEVSILTEPSPETT
jgi:hypothetical protein